jgi:hypothetical protein
MPRRDSIVPGLLVRVTEKGTRTFMLQSRFPGSTQPTRRAIGEYGSVSLERAREKARNWIELVHKGIDPTVVEEEERQTNLRLQANTFAAVAEDYLRLQVIGPDPAKPPPTESQRGRQGLSDSVHRTVGRAINYVDHSCRHPGRD